MRTTSTFAQNLLGMQSELRRFALKLTADAEDANDLLQETSLKALDNEEKYTPDTNFKGWMYTIMRNIFINNYRKTVRDQTFVDQTENLYHLNLPQDSGFESTEGNYDLKEIRKIVHSLPKEYRVPFSMYVSGFKYREIAEKLGLPIGTKSNNKRGRNWHTTVSTPLKNSSQAVLQFVQLFFSVHYH